MAMMTEIQPGDEIQEARDWQGNQVSCESCPHHALLAESKCRLKLACIEDRYARRVDRFFEWNPHLANSSLTHPYFEVRAIAAKHADVFQLPSLLADDDETVRWSAAMRLPQQYLLRLIDDAHREVRIRVAARLDAEDLVLMMKDSDYYVRLVVARRIAGHLLRLMRSDAEPEVRRVVAKRIDLAWLAPLTEDADPAVRLQAVERLLPGQLIPFESDPDWRIRHEFARRVRIERLGPMLDDSDPMVREMARARMDAAKTGRELVMWRKEMES